MKILKWAVLVLLGLIVLFVGIGLTLPSHYKVERSAEIPAPPDRVYALLASPRSWKDWGVWSQRDPAMKITYEGPESGEGAKWTWQSASEGNGSMTLTKADPGHALEYALDFPDFGSSSTGIMTLTPTASGTFINWTNEGDLGNNPMMRWMGLSMDKLVGNDFSTSLENLKIVAAKEPPAEAPAKPELPVAADAPPAGAAAAPAPVTATPPAASEIPAPAK